MTPEPFDIFWAAYPRKVGKGDARKAFKTAIKLTDIETMLASIEAYKRGKPDWQNFCHPATWLRQERWDDEWPAPQQATGGAPRSFDNVIEMKARTNYRPAFLRAYEGKE